MELLGGGPLGPEDEYVQRQITVAIELKKDSAAPGSPQGQVGRGRGARAFGARVVGVLLLALGLGLGYAGVVSGFYEPFAKTTPGTITVERCSHDDGGRTSVKECEGEFVSDDGKTTYPYADVPTDEPYSNGHRIDALEIGDYTYATSIAGAGAGAVASGLRYLFGGLAALGGAVFCLAVGRWPGPRAAGALRSMHPAFFWATYPTSGIGLAGFFVASIVKWGF